MDIYGIFSQPLVSLQMQIPWIKHTDLLQLSKWKMELNRLRKPHQYSYPNAPCTDYLPKKKHENHPNGAYRTHLWTWNAEWRMETNHRNPLGAKDDLGDLENPQRPIPISGIIGDQLLWKMGYLLLTSIIVPFPTGKNNIDTNSKPDNWCLHTYISSVSLIHFTCYKLQPYIHGHQLTWKLNWGSFEKTIWLYIWRYWIHNDSHSIWILMK